MSKRKILMLATALCMVAILAVGGTLAYFTSEDSADNVFTMGYVKIDLEENYEQNSNLLPGVDISKQVYVKNVGNNDAYVRVHIAIPTKMDDGDPSYDASQNFLHFNFTKASYADGQWSWLPANSEGAGYKGNGAGNWNFYTQNINGEDYNVYVVTYRTALEPQQQTETNAIEKVYLDPSVDAVANFNENGEHISTTYSDNKGNSFTLTVEQADNIQIKIWAEGTQTDPFTNAYDALNAAFGEPGTYNPWATPAE